MPDQRTNMFSDDVGEFEPASKYYLHPDTEEWSSVDAQMKLEEEPFERGGARVCYRAKELMHDGSEREVVAKLFLEKTADKQRYFNEAMTQMLAHEYAEEFNSYNVTRTIGFNSIHVCKLVERGGQLATVEPFLEGQYFKHNDNDGYVFGNDPIPQAFSHFSWEVSNHQLLICDIQGVGDLYTDPQIHTVSGDNFGVGNMGAEGICKFFRSHRCNHLCRALHLPPRGKLAQAAEHSAPSSPLPPPRQGSKEASRSDRDADAARRKSRGSFKSFKSMLRALTGSAKTSSPVASATGPGPTIPSHVTHRSTEKEARALAASVNLKPGPEPEAARPVALLQHDLESGLTVRASGPLAASGPKYASPPASPQHRDRDRRASDRPGRLGDQPPRHSSERHWQPEAPQPTFQVAPPGSGPMAAPASESADRDARRSRGPAHPEWQSECLFALEEPRPQPWHGAGSSRALADHRLSASHSHGDLQATGTGYGEGDVNLKRTSRRQRSAHKESSERAQRPRSRDSSGAEAYYY